MKNKPPGSILKDGDSFIKIENITGVIEAGWRPEVIVDYAKKSAGEAGEKALYAWMKAVLRDVKAHSQSWPFAEPVSREVAPDYYDVIKEPMDLKTVGNRIRDKFYTDRDVFFCDMVSIFDNCRKYNAPGSEYYDAADVCDKYFRQRASQL